MSGLGSSGKVAVMKWSVAPVSAMTCCWSGSVGCRHLYGFLVKNVACRGCYDMGLEVVSDVADC